MAICKIQALIAVISKKWVLQIFRALILGADSFTAIMKEAEGINSRILTNRLSELEKHKLVERKIVSTKPVKIRYYPTEYSKELSKEFDNIERIIRSWNL